MNLVDLLLNLAGVILWVNWWAIGFVQAPLAATISSVLKHAEPRRTRRFWFLVWLLALLGVRSVLYWRVGVQVNWVPVLDLGVVSLPFNSASPWRMLAYSAGGFSLTLAVFYLWLILLSVVNRKVPDTEVWQKLVRLHLGWFQSLPAAVKLAIPPVAVAGLWALWNPLLVNAGMAARPLSSAHLWQQAALVGLGTVLAWKYLLTLVLFLGVVNSYLYLGNFSLWAFINTTARNLLKPLQPLPLRVGRIDLAPVVGIALVWLVFNYGEKGLNLLFAHLPL